MRHRRRPKRSRQIFSKAELAVVGVVVGVLAAIAVPLYQKHARNARIDEATRRLAQIVRAAQTWARENRDAAGEPVWPPEAGADIVDLSGTEHFEFRITEGAGRDASGSPLEITARGREGSSVEGYQVIVEVPSVDASGDAPRVLRRER